jgi:hypothetical protein
MALTCKNFGSSYRFSGESWVAVTAEFTVTVRQHSLLAGVREAGGGPGHRAGPTAPPPTPLDHLHTVARHAGAPRRYSLFVILTGRGGGVVRAGP